MTRALRRPLFSAVRAEPYILTNHDDDFSVIFATPANAPTLWREYLLGARSAYRRYGCEAAIDVDAIIDGRQTTMFVAIVDPMGAVIGGLRVQGPFVDADESHALLEWQAGGPREALRSVIDERIADGITEVKTAWSDERAMGSRAGAIADQMARSSLLLLQVSGARHLMATAAEHVLALWASGGGRVCDSVPTTPYPDERYRTRLMLWDIERMALDADPDTWTVMVAESQMLRPLSAVADGRVA